ncbi:MAG TPA: DUF1349 domain-containing protein [Verrucomicrobiae bacterium]|nr:DUF1349 domain-containing protein [Verrucomicrobiae bacterium]
MKTATLIRAILTACVILTAAMSPLFATDESRNIPGWGVCVDPDGDCQFSVKDGKLTISIPGRDHALAIERGRTNAPRVMQEAEGNFTVTVKVATDYAPGTTSVVQTRRAFQGAGLVLWQDDGNYVRLERAQLVVGAETMKYASFELRRDGQFTKPGFANEHPLKTPTTWLRLERQSNQIMAAVSEDGQKWESLKPLRVDLSRNLKVGVLAGHNTSTPMSAVFQDFKVSSPGNPEKR